MNIEIRFDQILFNENGGSTGAIWLEFGDIAFPEKSWNDFVDIILGWWIEAYNNFLEGKTKYCEFNFMDGPYFIRIENLIDSKKLELLLYKGDVLLKVIVVERCLIMNELFQVTNHLIRHYSENNWSNDDLIKIKALFKKLSVLKQR